MTIGDVIVTNYVTVTVSVTVTSSWDATQAVNVTVTDALKCKWYFECDSWGDY